MSFEQTVRAAVDGAIDSLLDLQDDDGLWREFALQPGTSEAWVTAWVGWCLLRSVGGPSQDAASRVTSDLAYAAHSRVCRVRWSCARASASVRRLRRTDGWGYNRASGADADSTAWAIRFLMACGDRLDPLPWLKRFVDAGGGVHTFIEDGWGTWTDAHDDVAANVGLALLPCIASRPLAHRIGRWLVARWPVRTFWWSTPIYGRAWSLRLLGALNTGVPGCVRDDARSWLSSQPAATDAFEDAHRLMMATALGERRHAERLANGLLDIALARGWRGASHLLVPPRDDDACALPNLELHGLLTTSLCVLALSEFMAFDAPLA